MDAPPDTARDLSERLARVETKLDLLLSEFQRRRNDHESRLLGLERRVWILSGASVAGGGAVGTLVAHLTGGA